jgi:HlyD family secretion protein
MRRFLKTPVITIAVVVLVCGVGAWWWHVRNDPQLSFRTALVKRGDLVATINATGTIEPVEVVDVGAQVAGLIRSFGKDRTGKTIDYGSVVEEETVLAQIDDSVYAADVALARAQLEQVKANLLQAEADWKRAQELTNSKLVPLSDYDSSKAGYEVAKASVAIAEATLRKAQRNLDFCVIKSPVKGVIIDRRVNIGQTVVSSLNAPSLFLIAKDLTKMQIWVAVNEADIGRIVPGAPVTFACDAFPGKEFNGAVGKVRLNATMTQNVVMYTVEVNTENTENILLPYLTANVRFVVRTESNTLSVPNAALRWSPSSLAEVSPGARSWKPVDPKEHSGIVWVKEGEFVQPVEVKLGASDGLNTAILSGNVREGQEVVTGESADKPPAVTKNPFIPQLRRR